MAVKIEEDNLSPSMMIFFFFFYKHFTLVLFAYYHQCSETFKNKKYCLVIAILSPIHSKSSYGTYDKNITGNTIKTVYSTSDR